MSEIEAKAPRALQAILDAIEQAKKEIKRIEEVLSAGGLTPEEEDDLQRKLREVKRQLRNLKGSFQPGPSPPSTVDPRRR